MRTPESGETFRFGDFVLDVAGCELRRDHRRVKLGRQAMDILILLVLRRGQLVRRSDIVDRLWGQDVFVDVETGVERRLTADSLPPSLSWPVAVTPDEIRPIPPGISRRFPAGGIGLWRRLRCSRPFCPAICPLPPTPSPLRAKPNR